MYMMDEHEAFQAMAVFLERCGVDDVLSVLLDIGLNPDGTTHDPASWPEWLAAVHDVRKGMVRGAPLEAAPQPVKDLGAQLEAAGFEQMIERDDQAAIGGGYLEWRRRGLGVRALRDRLEWTIWIGGALPLGWLSVSVWEEFTLRGRLPADQSTLTLTQQCERTAALADLLPAVDDPRAMLDAMLKLRRPIPSGYVAQSGRHHHR